MAWVVVPNLNELLAQMNARFPNRDKASDGAIGNTSHAARASSHNPDRTGSPDYRDGDARDEVRARDIDKDLNSPDGMTMEKIVQHWLTNARAGKLWWVRYIIFNGRIWHKRDNFVTRKYTGSNKHEKHVHVNSDFTQKADSVTGTNWLLKDLGKPKPKPPVTPSKPVASPTKENEVELSDTVKISTQFQADTLNLNVTDPKAKLKVGDTVRVDRLLMWGGPGIERLYAKARASEAREVAAAAQLKALVTAVQALASNSPNEVRTAFNEGIASIENAMKTFKTELTDIDVEVSLSDKTP